MNSTLGSVVPLAMFFQKRDKYVLKILLKDFLPKKSLSNNLLVAFLFFQLQQELLQPQGLKEEPKEKGPQKRAKRKGPTEEGQKEKGPQKRAKKKRAHRRGPKGKGIGPQKRATRKEGDSPERGGHFEESPTEILQRTRFSRTRRAL